MRIGLYLSMGAAAGSGFSRSENIWLQSSAFGTSWAKNPVGLTITANTTLAPDGTTTADTITDNVDGGATSHFVEQLPGGPPANGTVLVASVYAKAGTKSAIAIVPNAGATGYTFNLSTGAIGSQVTSAPLDKGIAAAANGFYRCWVKFAYVSGTETRIYMTNSTSSITYTGDGTGTVILWGAQMNTVMLRKYTATTTTIVTL